MSKIKVNGADLALEKEVNISQLLLDYNVSQPAMVSVQLNGSFVKREEFDTTFVKEGDEVDFLFFMGGGAL